MKVETKLVKVGETPEDKCPSYEKRTAETFEDTFQFVENFVPTPAQLAAIRALDNLFPEAKIKDKDGKEIAVPNPFRETLLGHTNYGKDLFAKAVTRRKFEATLEDPSKVIVAAVRTMITAGFDSGMAYDLVLAQRQAKGMDTPAKDLILAKLK